MAVSNPASMSSVYAEFGAPAGTPLSSFLRGGAYVPNVAANNNVPTSLPINLQQLAGAVKYVPISISGPSSVSGETFGLPTTQTTYSNPATFTVSGGNPSPSVSWAYLSGDNTISQNVGGLNSVQWNAAVNRNLSKTGVWRLTVSDGVSSATKDVTINLIHSP